MSFAIQFTDKALAHIEKLKKSGNIGVTKKIRRLLDELKEHPEKGTGKPEKLKYDYNGYWSRRINHEHRLVYFIDSNLVTVTVISVYGHYESLK